MSFFALFCRWLSLAAGFLLPLAFSYCLNLYIETFKSISTRIVILNFSWPFCLGDGKQMSCALGDTNAFMLKIPFNGKVSSYVGVY